MWRIIQLLGKFSNLILFLFLEIVSLIIIINLNEGHREISKGFLTEVSGGLSNIQSNIGGYFNLVSENEKLMEQNAMLQARLLAIRDSLDSYRYLRPGDLGFIVFPDSIKKDSTKLDSVQKLLLPDSIMPISGFRFIPCKAVNNSVNRNYNYITINKGRNHGVKRDMGLISPEGVAGQIIETGPNYSLALSILNRRFNLSCRILSNHQVGTLIWDEGDPAFANLKYIPQTSIINKGDTVVTSGFSTIFPPNYMVGTIADFNTRDQEGFYKIKIQLSTDFRKIDNLFLVNNIFQPELDSLEKVKVKE